MESASVMPAPASAGYVHAPAITEITLRTALGWALENDADTRTILRDCPELALAHGVLQASARRTHWTVAISASAIGIQRTETIAGATAARSLRLPDHLRAAP